VEEPDDPLILYASACYFARFGDRNMAIDLLRRAIAAGYTNFAYIEQDPDMGSLRGEKAYEELLRNRGSGS
jgi:adenylate cyclase